MTVSEFVKLPARKIANITGVLETTLSKYFNGHRNPSYTSLEYMAKKLNMNVEDVMKGIRLRREKKEILPKLTRV